MIWQASPIVLFASSRQGNEEIYRLGSAERTACTMSAVVLHSMPIGDRASQMVLAIAAGGATASAMAPMAAQLTVPSGARRRTIPGVAPVCWASSTTTTPLTSTVVRAPVGYWCGSA